MYAEDVRDRRKHVHVPGIAVVDAPALLTGQLDEQWDERDVAEVPPRDVAARAVGEERFALVAGDDQERAVVDAGRSQPVQEDAERLVGVRELQQVALLGLKREP